MDANRLVATVPKHLASGPAETAARQLALVWAGLVLGVSFLATPVKFLAPSLSLPAALDVGRQTFFALNLAELALGTVLAGLGFSSAWSVRWHLACLVPGLIAALQAVWLLPLLDARVQQVLDGVTPTPSLLHQIYIACDLAKLGLLLTLGVLVMSTGGSSSLRR